MSLAVVFHKLFFFMFSQFRVYNPMYTLHNITLHTALRVSKFYTSMQCQCCHNIHVKSTVVIFQYRMPFTFILNMNNRIKKYPHNALAVKD